MAAGPSNPDRVQIHRDENERISTNSRTSLDSTIQKTEMTVLVILWLAVAIAIGQKFHRIPGVFDLFDILAYAMGIAVVLLIDLWLGGRARTMA